MRKRLFLVLACTLLMICITGCQNKKALEFKKDYESVNGNVNSSGKENRIVNINENNPYERITAKEVLEKIDKKETFYVYFGDKLCPWCRSVIEKSIEVANELGIKKIYYVAIWDDEGKEILRSRYALEEGKLVKTIEGTEEYYKLLEVFNDLLSDYNLTDEKGNNVATGEKRIYAPNYIYIEKGKAKKLTGGISKIQQDPREELTKEILKEEEELFREFFTK